MKIKAVIVDEKPSNCAECNLDFCKLWMRGHHEADKMRHPDCPLFTEAEYASQFTTLPSDEEIEKMARMEMDNCAGGDSFKLGLYSGFKTGIGWILNRIASQFTAPEKGVKS